MSERITLHRNIIRALEHLSYDINLSTAEILSMHKRNPNGWGSEGKTAALNSMNYELMKTALTKGFLVDTTMDGVDPNLKKIVNNKAQELFNSIKGLEAELDYELLTLSEAMKSNDQQSITRSKKRLHEIHEELGLGLQK